MTEPGTIVMCHLQQKCGRCLAVEYEFAAFRHKCPFNFENQLKVCNNNKNETGKCCANNCPDFKMEVFNET